MFIVDQNADVVELVYTTDLKSVGRKTMRVQVPPSAPFTSRDIRGLFHRNYSVELFKNNLFGACQILLSLFV